MMMAGHPAYLPHAPGNRMSVTLPASAAGILPSWTAAGFPCPGNLLVHDNRPGLDFPAYKKRRYKQRERKTVPFLQKLISLFEEHPELIKFDKGTIVIPNPKRLELVLPSYFRHGKYTSFQRQLNNFGYTKFDKSAGPLQSIYVKAKGPPVSSFQDLLTLRHSFRRVPAEDDDESDDYMHHPPQPSPAPPGAYAAACRHRALGPRIPMPAAYPPLPAPLPSHIPVVAPPLGPYATDHEQQPAALVAGASPLPAPQLPPAVQRPPPPPPTLVPPAPKQPGQPQRCTNGVASQQHPPQPPPKDSTSALEAVDNLLNLRHARLGQPPSPTSADEPPYAPFPHAPQVEPTASLKKKQKREDNYDAAAAAATAAQHQMPQGRHFSQIPALGASNPPWGRDYPPEPPVGQSLNGAAGQQPHSLEHHYHEIDRANLTIDILRSKLAASEQDRRAALVDALRLRGKLAAFTMHNDEGLFLQPQSKQQQRMPTEFQNSPSRYFVSPKRGELIEQLG